MQKTIAEYIWIDGQRPTAKLRSKTKIIDGAITKLSQLPEWCFDGSSTYQATSRPSDLLLKPVYFINDPVRKGKNILVLCEVYNMDNTPHWSNTRAYLREVAKKYKQQEPLFGIEQEYTLFDGNRPYGWPDKGFPAPQGGYYCGIGCDEVFGRELVEAHRDACLEAGISIVGTNAEVMPSQWEFQIGALGPLAISDEQWLARWLLYRIGENFGISAKLHPKPVQGNWNPAGCHTNFSTKQMRAAGGLKEIKKACKKLGKTHKEHITVYGAGNEERMEGRLEASDIHTFSWGVSDRLASIRIPYAVANAGRGYLEDRRPAANADPYRVCAAILESVCGQGFKAKVLKNEENNKIAVV